MTSLAVGFYALCMLAVVTALVCGSLYACAQAVELVGRAAARLRRDPPAPDPERRVGDRDRVRALAVLRDGYADGRLDLPELELRADAALAARTARELGVVVCDLARSAPVRLRSHELAAGFALLLFSSTAIRVLGLCLVSARCCARACGRSRSRLRPACSCRCPCPRRSFWPPCSPGSAPRVAFRSGRSRGSYRGLSLNVSLSPARRYGSRTDFASRSNAVSCGPLRNDAVPLTSVRMPSYSSITAKLNSASSLVKLQCSKRSIGMLRCRVNSEPENSVFRS